MSREEIQIRITEIEAILENNLYENEHEETLLMKEKRDLERQEVQKWYDEVAEQLDKMPQNFAFWYLLKNQICQWENEIIQISECSTKEEVAYSYELKERVRVFKEAKDEIEFSIF